MAIRKYGLKPAAGWLLALVVTMAVAGCGGGSSGPTMTGSQITVANGGTADNGTVRPLRVPSAVMRRRCSSFSVSCRMSYCESSLKIWVWPVIVL